MSVQYSHDERWYIADLPRVVGINTMSACTCCATRFAVLYCPPVGVEVVLPAEQPGHGPNMFLAFLTSCDVTMVPCIPA